MRNQYILTGKIVSGVRKASFFTQLDWVQEQCARKLGFRPYPGTLNIEIDKSVVSVLETLQGKSGIALVPPDPEFCIAKTLPVTIGTEKGAIIIPAEDVNVHDKNIIEVLAPLRLKTALGVNDGDTVTLTVAKPLVEEKA